MISSNQNYLNIKKMGNELCNSGPQEELEKVDYNPDQEQIDEEINKIIRKGEPSQRIAYNINKLPDFLKESTELTKMQQKIAKLIAHEKRHQKPMVLTKNSSQKNHLPDPYYIRSLDGIYIGQWVLDKDINQVVPGGLGRLYTQQRIIQGEITTVPRSKHAIFEEDSAAFNITGQMVRHNKEKANFFSAVKNNAITQQAINSNVDFIDINVTLHGQGRSFTRTIQLKGIFLFGELTGKGYCKIKEGEDFYQYTGEFKSGKKNGKGIQKFKLTSYDGDFENDMKTGKGTLTLLISRSYQKQRLQEEAKLTIQDKQKDPSEKVLKVKEYIRQKAIFEQLLNEEMKKDFKWIPPKYPVKSMTQNENFVIDHHRRIKFLQNYKGSFVNNNFEGHGIYSWFNGKCYNGEWKKGQMDGIGQFYWPKGILYRGEYEKDMRHGKGEMLWSLQKRFRGSWAYGLRHGYGELIQIESQADLKDKTNNIYFLRVKGALFDKDKLAKQYFNTRRQIDNLKLQQLKLHQKIMISFVRDIKID